MIGAPEHNSESDERKLIRIGRKVEFLRKRLGMTDNPAVEIKGEC